MDQVGRQLNDGREIESEFMPRIGRLLGRCEFASHEDDRIAGNEPHHEERGDCQGGDHQRKAKKASDQETHPRTCNPSSSQA